MSNENIIRKINKLSAIVNDPKASENEVQSAIALISKLRIQYKIDEKDICSIESNFDDVIIVELENKGYGYIYNVVRIIARTFQCEVAKDGRFSQKNVEFTLIGLKKDIELLKPLAEMVVYYLESKLKNIHDLNREGVDLRIFKSSYMQGFTEGINIKINDLILEMNLDKKQELAIIDTPTIVKDYIKANCGTRRTATRTVHKKAYEKGKEDGLKYNIHQKDLLK